LSAAEAAMEKSNQKYRKSRKLQEKSLEELNKAKGGQGNPSKIQKNMTPILKKRISPIMNILLLSKT